jgi:hypothetical protein
VIAAVGTTALLMTVALVTLVAIGAPARALHSPESAVAPRVPIELLSLDHAREGNRLTIYGTVRNPAGSRDVCDLVAVVSLFGQDSTYLGMLQVPVVNSVLAPGTDSPFEISVADSLSVARYRLSFKIADTPVPHVDRRPGGIIHK